MPAYKIERGVKSSSSYILSMVQEWSIYCHAFIYGIDSLHDGNSSRRAACLLNRRSKSFSSYILSMVQEWSIYCHAFIYGIDSLHDGNSSRRAACLLNRRSKSFSSYILSMVQEWSIYWYAFIYGIDSLHDGNCSPEEMPAYQIEEELYENTNLARVLSTIMLLLLFSRVLLYNNDNI